MTAGLLPDIPFGSGEVRQCGTCLRWYRITHPRVVCAVMHPPGSCCHYGDQEVPAPIEPDAPTDVRRAAVQPTQGRIVLYKLAEHDALAINGNRADAAAFSDSVVSTSKILGPPRPGQRGRTGHAVHVGNDVQAGDVFPALVVRVFGPEHDLDPCVNLKVELDGTDSHWATSRTQGDEPGQWSWPVVQNHAGSA